MAKREKLEGRFLFSRNERLEILKKSDGKCSHCGKTLDGFFTVDHVIPLNKGGSNDNDNLVALCESCNKEKADLIVEPASYFKYVRQDILELLLKNQEKYKNDFEWFAKDTLLPEDIVELKLAYAPMLKGMASKCRKGECIRTKYVQVSCFIKRASEGDLEKLIKFCREEVIKSLRFEKLKDALNSAIEHDMLNWFNNGAIYYLANPNGSIRAVIPVLLSPFDDNFSAEDVNTCDGVIPYFPLTFQLKHDFNYNVAIARVYAYILSNMVKVLKRPVYYRAKVSLAFGLGSHLGMDTISFLSDEVCGLDFIDDNDYLTESYFTGKWGSSDDSVLSTDFIENYKHELSSGFDFNPLPTDRFKYLSLNNGKPQLWVKDDLDVDSFIEKRRHFGKFLARTLGYKVINDKHIVATVEDDYNYIDLELSKLSVPNGVEIPKTIPVYINTQLKRGGLRPIEIDENCAIRKSEVNLYAYHKQCGTKVVKCKYKKGLELEINEG